MTTTRTQTNSDGDLLIWWHSSVNADPDEDTAGIQDCATCEFAVELAAPHWGCTDNGEVIHEHCALPDW